jgi:hypothetical protein
VVGLGLVCVGGWGVMVLHLAFVTLVVVVGGGCGGVV